MGKAKRFNIYDSSISESRKQVKSFGQARQEKAGFSSSFRNSPIASSPGGTSGSATVIPPATGASFPLQYGVNDQGTKGASATINHDLGQPTGHKLKVTLNGDVTINFTNIPASGTAMDWLVEITQDGTGGHTATFGDAAAFVPALSLSTTLSTTSLVAFHTDDNGTIIRVITLLNATASSAAFSGNLSDLTIDTDFDANGVRKYILDADADTYLISDTDDQIEFFTGATEKMRLTTELQMQGGVNLDLNGNDLVLDADADTYIHSLGDDQMEFYSGGGNRLTITGIDVTVSASVETKLNDLLSFDTGITTPVGSDRNMIYTENLATDELVINGLSGGSIRFDFDGTEYMGMSESEIRFTGDSTANRVDVFFERTDSVPADNDIISKTSYLGDNSIGNPVVWATQTVRQEDVTSGTEDASIDWSVVLGSSLLFQSYIMGENTFTFRSEDNNPRLVINRSEPSTPATGVIGQIFWETEDAGSTVTRYGEILVQADDITAGNETSSMILYGYNDGTKEDFVHYEGGVGVTIVDGSGSLDKLAFFNVTPVVQQTGVAVTAAGIHAALVNFGLITA